MNWMTQAVEISRPKMWMLINNGEGKKQKYLMCTASPARSDSTSIPFHKTFCGLPWLLAESILKSSYGRDKKT